MDGIERRQGHFLPHWTANEGTYFVTFRLNDSLPKPVLDELDQEYRRLVAVEENSIRRQLNADDVRKAKSRIRNQIEKYLDAGHGSCYLSKPECALIVVESLAFFDKDRYRLGTWSVMPNHVHPILRPLGVHALEEIVKSWKSFTARRINALVGRSGSLWQSEPFDHLIRNEESLLKLSRYVLDNPTKAHLQKPHWLGVGSLGPVELAAEFGLSGGQE